VQESETWGNEHTYILVSHVSHLEPTFEIAPMQSPLLSTISVIQIGPMSAEELLGVMAAVYVGDGKHVLTPGVRFEGKVSEVELSVEDEDDRWRRICIDGDVITVAKNAKVNVTVCDGIALQDESILVVNI
jgi:hypothetical protein